MAAVGVSDSGHIGRIGEWAEHGPEEGPVFVSQLNLPGGGHRISRHGSADSRLGTNSVTVAVTAVDALPFDIV